MNNKNVKYILIYKPNMTLEHKSSHKQHRYICSQQYIVWVNIICQKSLDIKIMFHEDFFFLS